MTEKIEYEYATIKGRKCRKIKGTSTWEVIKETD